MKLNIDNVISDEFGRSLDLIFKPGDFVHICRNEHSSGRSSSSVGITNDHGQWENNTCYYNVGWEIVQSSSNSEIITRPATTHEVAALGDLKMFASHVRNNELVF